MELYNLAWVFVIWTLTKKYEWEYEKEGQKYKSYTLEFAYLWGKNSVKVDEVLYTKATEWVIYAIEVNPYTKEWLKFTTLLSNKNKKFFEILENNNLNDIF